MKYKPSIKLSKILEINIQLNEIIIVDDYSNDGTYENLSEFKNNKLFKIIRHKKNMGKGAGIISAIPFLTSEYVIIQDGDLEYNPNDYKRFVDLIKQNKEIEVIYGSRVLGKKLKKAFRLYLEFFANFVLTALSNLLNNQKLTDAHTCYKFMKSKIIRELNLTHNDFLICPEITAKLSKLKYQIIEIPISYNGRSYSEGKK